MGVITDFIVGNKKHAEKICAMKSPERSKKFHSEEIRSLDAINLDALFSLVEDGSHKKFKGSYKKFNEHLAKDYPLLFQESESGSWLYQLPDQSVYAFASKFERQDLPALAKEWMKTGTMKDWGSPGGEFEAVLSTLENLHQLCKEALEQQVSVLMWMCLERIEYEIHLSEANSVHLVLLSYQSTFRKLDHQTKNFGSSLARCDRA